MPGRQGHCRYIADALKRSGVSTWFDELGDSIVQHIERGVASSDFVLVLLSPASVKSHWTQEEWSAAFSKELNDNLLPRKGIQRAHRRYGVQGLLQFRRGATDWG